MISVREIALADNESVIGLLMASFPQDGDRAYWDRGFARMRWRPVPWGKPRYGWKLIVDSRLAGALLTIWSRHRGHLYCNLSSWACDSRYRMLGPLLSMRATADASATYLNMSPEPHTLQIIQAMGFHSIGWAYAKGPQILGLDEIETEAQVFAWAQQAAA